MASWGWDADTVSASIRSSLTSGNSACSSVSTCCTAGAHEEDRPAALGTVVRQGLGIAAVVAHKPVVGLVVGELDTAPRALGHLAAFGADGGAAGAPTVEEQDGLLPSGDGLRQFVPQQGADGGIISRPQLLLHIGEEHFGQGPLVEPLLELEQLVVACLSVVHSLHRWGGRAQH